MRKTQKRKPKTNNSQDQEDGEQVETNKENKGFYACYLLTSLCPRFKGHTYIGFTVNPRRRIRQHNGEIRCGAFRTKKRRPWEMVLCLYGFPSNVSALQFEWAWQHPTESLAVRQAAATFKTFSGVANKIKLAYTMLNLPPWKSLNITVNYFSTMYMKHSAACPSLPEHMKVQVCSMNELPCYNKMGESFLEDESVEIGFDEELRACDINSQPTTEIGFDKTLNKGELQACGANSQPTTEIGFDETVNNEFGFDEGMNIEELQDCGSNSLPATALPSLASCSLRDSVVRNMRPLAEDSVYELDSPQRNESISKTSCEESTDKTHCWWNECTSKIASDKDQHLIDSPAVRHQIEVIDLLSPSPECRISFINKKRRVSVVSPIIDLT